MSRFTRREIIVAAAGMALGRAWAAEPWVEGKNYFRIERPPTVAGQGAPAVTEIFSYGCPACNAFLPYMQSLEKKLPANAALEYLPAGWIAAENWPALQRAYLTAKALGVAKKAHVTMFDAVWKTGELASIDPRTQRPKSPLPSLQDIARFYERVAAVPVAKFLETAKSFAVDSDIRRTDSLIKAYGADSTPTIIVNGVYRLDPGAAGGAQQAVDLTLWLLRRK